MDNTPVTTVTHVLTPVILEARGLVESILNGDAVPGMAVDHDFGAPPTMPPLNRWVHRGLGRLVYCTPVGAGNFVAVGVTGLGQAPGDAFAFVSYTQHPEHDPVAYTAILRLNKHGHRWKLTTFGPSQQAPQVPPVLRQGIMAAAVTACTP